MSDTHRIFESVAAQFGPVAANYATSTGHNDPNVLSRLVALCRPGLEDQLLDVGTGAGNVALAFAPYVRHVVALDLTPQMIEETVRRAREAGYSNVEGIVGPAEKLPFPDASFQLVVCRLCAHHFSDVAAAVGEMNRVLAPGGKLMIMDSVAPEDDELDKEINAIEVLRDPSHVRNYRPSEWRAMLQANKLRVVHEDLIPYLEAGKPVQFETWVTRIRTPDANILELRSRFQNASAGLRKVMSLQISGKDISFSIPQSLFVAVK